MHKWFNGFLACAAVLAVAACGDPTKQEIVDKGRSADTRQQLEAELGKPDTLDKVGPVEKWTYNASDGTVTFIITGDTVAMQATGAAAGE